MHAGLDLAAIRGSGPQGRIVKADIERALAQPGAAAPHVRRAALPPEPRRSPPACMPRRRRRPPVFAKEQVLALAGNPPYSEKPHTAMRRVIARRLTEVEADRPAFLSCRSIARSTSC